MQQPPLPVPHNVELTVCFADTCDSTSLFEEYGDERAKEVVSRTLHRISEAVEERGGKAIKTLGDGLMSTFSGPTPAARAALGFPDAVRKDETLAALGIEVRWGFCHGSVVREEGGDVYGDAVNIASRLVDWANASQVVTTAETTDVLPDSFPGFTRDLGEKTLRGKTETVELVELVDEQSDPNLTVVEKQVQSFYEDGDALLLLRHGGQEYHVQRDSLRLGRGGENDLQIDDRRVSRKHAVVEREAGSFQVVDRSTNGTYVEIGEENVTFVHHGQLHLHGIGRISLGRPIEAEEASPIRFECERNTEEGLSS